MQTLTSQSNQSGRWCWCCCWLLVVVEVVVVMVVVAAVASHLKAHGAEAAVLHLDVGHPVKAGAHLRQKEIVRKS